MYKIGIILTWLFQMVSNFLPPTIWFIIIPFVAIGAFFKVVREVR